MSCRLVAVAGAAVFAASVLACSGSISPGYGEADDEQSAVAKAGAGGAPSASGAAGRAATPTAPAAGGNGSSTPTARPPVATAGSSSTSTGSTPAGAYCDAPGKIFNNDNGCNGDDRGCHGSGSINGDFAVSLQNLLALKDKEPEDKCGKFIDTANPKASLLLTMTQSPTPPGCFPLTMPESAPQLSDDDKACIENWLTQF